MNLPEVDKAADTIAARELFLQLTNDGDFYRRRTSPLLANYAKKLSRGNYDKNKAVKGFYNLVTEYAKHHADGGNDPTWFTTYTVDTRRAVASQIERRYKEEVTDIASK